MQKAKEFYNLPQYQKIIGLRHSSAYTEWVFVEGV
jgi:uncharacterized protein (DUF1330 family)